jgi:uncharacterized protein DUF3187
MLRSLAFAFIYTSITWGAASAQNLCPLGITSVKLICLLPQVYGKDGLVLSGSPSASPSSQFHTNFLGNSLSTINSAVAKQSAFLPTASPASSISFSWSPTTPGTPIQPSDSLGPILGERAETIGKYHVLVGFGYQYFNFDRLDAISLKHLPVVYPQVDDSVDFAPRVCSVNGDNTTQCAFIRDVITTDNRVDLKIHQFTTVVTYGITNRVDVSLVVPIENIRMGIVSNTTIVDNSQSTFHTFEIQQNVCGSVSVDNNGNLIVVPCLHHSFSNVRAASGIGDIGVRGKAMLWKGERAGLAVGIDLRMPTGDEQNFLGTGAFGTKPFIVWSYRWRVSPHIFVGYETNGNSVLAGDILTGKKARLPDQLTYTGGAEVWITKWFTAAFDLLGQQVFEAPRTSLTKFKELGACLQPPYPNCSTPATSRALDDDLTQSIGTFNSTNASLGFKVSPIPGLVITGNVMMKLNEGGLRANVVPLAGVSYTF